MIEMTAKKQKIKNVPNLRFPGFDNEWEQKMLGDVAKFSKGKGISKNDIEEDGAIECIRYGELYTHYKEVIVEIKSRTNVDKSNLVLSEANDVIIPSSGETQIDIATASCVLNSGVALGGDLNIIKTDNNGVFLSYYLNSKKKMEIASLAQGISVVHLYSSQLASLKMNFPSLAEQNKIASFLSSLNERIHTQNKIIEKLETLIKGIRECLLNRGLRFSGFSDEWKKYKVSDLLQFFPTNSLSWEQLDYHGSGTLYNLHYGLIHQGAPTLIDTDNYRLPTIKSGSNPVNFTLCENGDIVFADASEDTIDVAKAVEIINCGDKKIVGGLHTIHGRDQLSLTVKGFKGYLFRSMIFRHQIRQLAQGTKVFSVSVRTFNECYVDIPSKNEQLKISALLAKTDQRIDCERKLLAKYKQQKIYLLGRLFI